MGSITISNNAVATIVGLAASKVIGITRMYEGLGKGLVKQVSGKSIHRGVEIEITQDGVVINTAIEVRYGVNIREVCKILQHEITAAIEFYTGLKVYMVNVQVVSMSVEAEDKHSG